MVGPVGLRYTGARREYGSVADWETHFAPFDGACYFCAGMHLGTSTVATAHFHHSSKQFKKKCVCNKNKEISSCLLTRKCQD